MSATLTPPAPRVKKPRVPHVPPLCSGDRMNRYEFERRYEQMSESVKAELIEGTVFMPPPAVSFTFHGEPHADFLGWLSFYKALTPGVRSGDNSSLRMDLDNMPQPDAFLMIPEARGGQAKVAKDGYLEGAPELVGEISASSASYDLHSKLNSYRRNGVREYVVWRTYDNEIDYFILRDGNFVRLEPGPDGLIRSEIFPGLWLDPYALMSGDLAGVSKAVQLGTATPEHAAFAARVKP